MILLHIDAKIRKSLIGEDVFYFESQSCADDCVFSFKDLNLIRRKIILISDNFLELPDYLSDSVFVFVPFKSYFWRHNFTLLLYSIEFVFLEYYSSTRSGTKINGKLENIIRIQSQTYLKFMKQCIAPSLQSAESRCHWLIECPMGCMLLFNYLMSYFFLSWIEFKKSKIHMKCPIERLFPQNINLMHETIYNFLESLTGT